MSQIAVQAHAARRQVSQAGAEAHDAPRARPGVGGTIADALGAIETYIPTEVVTVYAAVTAAIDSSAARTHTGQWVAFWLFLVLTPVANWCLYAAMLRGRQEPVPWRPQRDWPWYGMVTAAVAFALWGFTLSAPRSPASLGTTGRSAGPSCWSARWCSGWAAACSGRRAAPGSRPRDPPGPRHAVTGAAAARWRAG